MVVSMCRRKIFGEWTGGALCLVDVCCEVIDYGLFSFFVGAYNNIAIDKIIKI